jgi:glycosyltransferase involved in cell wall biosynthesis
MDVIPAHPQDFLAVLQAGSSYDSQRYIATRANGTHQTYSLHDQVNLYANNVDRIVELSEFDIIHAHDWLTFKAAMLAKKKTGKPLIVHIHATEYDRSGSQPGNPVVAEIEYQAMMMADRVITVSQTTKDIVVSNYGIPPDKISVVHNSITIDDYSIDGGANVYHYIDTMKRHGYKVVSNVGRLTIQKGLTHLLRSARLVVDRLPKTLFLIVGSGDQYIELVELSAELGISRNVMFAGFQRGKAWQDAYRVADLFVMPSASEPFGLTPLEATLFGVPSLISKQSGVKEVLRNVLLVDYWDETEMANQLVSALQSDGLRATLIEGARDELKQMCWSQSASKLQAIYQTHLLSETRV